MKKSVFLSFFIIFSIISITTASAFDNVYPTDAYQLATTNPDVYILDVRTEGEWRWVGHPGANILGEGIELEGKVVNVSYKIEKNGSFILNPAFLTDIEGLFGEHPNVVLITMCRSGKRSAAAATVLEGAGYAVLNMVTGFQGSKDTRGYRSVNGWINNGLPYSYNGTGYLD